VSSPASSLTILVVGGESVAGDAHRGLVGPQPVPDRRVVVVAPALSGRLAYWTSDDRAARRRAEECLRRCLGALHAAGVEACGYVGDADPLQAIDDALRLYRADEVLIATQPGERSNWLARDIVARARRRFRQPIRQVGAGRERPNAAAA
jgi:hypothetical protein